MLLHSSLSLSMINADKYHEEAHWSITNRVNPFNALWLVMEGEIEIHIFDTKIAVEAGDIVLLPRDTLFHAFYRNGCTHLVNYIARFHLQSSEGLDWFKRYRAPVRFADKNFAAFETFMFLCKDCTIEDPLKQMRADAELQLLLSHLLMNGAKQIHPVEAGFADNQTAIQDLLLWLDANLKEKERLTIKQLADRIHVSPDHFIDLFKHFTGLTPLQYIHRLQIKRSKQLLASSLMPIQMISSEVGLKDPLYFSRLFKRQEGLTPSDYRKLMTCM